MINDASLSCSKFCIIYFNKFIASYILRYAKNIELF